MKQYSFICCIQIVYPSLLMVVRSRSIMPEISLLAIPLLTVPYVISFPLNIGKVRVLSVSNSAMHPSRNSSHARVVVFLILFRNPQTQYWNIYMKPCLQLVNFACDWNLYDDLLAIFGWRNKDIKSKISLSILHPHSFLSYATSIEWSIHEDQGRRPK